MADGAETDEDDLELAGSKGKGSKGKLIILLVSAVLLLGGGAGAGLYFTGALASAEKVSVDGIELIRSVQRDNCHILIFLV